MSVELFFNKPVSGAFTGAFEGQIEDRASGAISFLGTASWAQNTETASFLEGTVESASFATTAAFAENAETASHALDFDGEISASQILPGTFQSGTYIFTGSVLVTGSLDAPSITGSLLGTASWAENAISASHAVNADTASFVESASFAENADSASLATTASFADKAAVAPMNISLNNFFGAEAKLQVPVEEIEHDDGQRTAVGLVGYTQARLIVRVTKAPNTLPGGVLAVQGSSDESSWVYLAGGSAGAGDGGPSASLDALGTIISPWQSITGSLNIDPLYLRWITYSGSDSGGNARPRVASINLQVR